MQVAVRNYPAGCHPPKTQRRWRLEGDERTTGDGGDPSTTLLKGQTYDALGEILTQTDTYLSTDTVLPTTTYANNTLGKVVSTALPSMTYYDATGTTLGTSALGSDTDYAASITQQETAQSTSGTFRNGLSTGTAYANFDQSYDPLNGYTQEGGDTSSTAVWRSVETMAG